jgi:hypothetical protein
MTRSLSASFWNCASSRSAAFELSPAFQRLVITQKFRDSRLLLFALEGRWILAGGETTGSRRPILRAPAGALDVNEFD